MSDLSRAFDFAADAYERGRPSYAQDAVAWLAERLPLRSGRTVLDLAAGSGKLTRQLALTGASVVAVEPGDEMRARLTATAPSVDVYSGTAEEIPLRDAAVDAVTVAQAFHWFDETVATREIARVLRPGGALAVLWNERDEAEPLQLRITAVLEHVGRAPAHDRIDLPTFLPGSGLFGPVEERTFRHRQVFHDERTFLDRFFSISYLAAASSTTRARVEAELLALVADAPRPLTIPYLTNVFVSARL